MNSEQQAEQQASWQRFFDFVFPEQAKLCEKMPFGVDATAKEPVLTEFNTEIQTGICTVFNTNSRVVPK